MTLKMTLCAALAGATLLTPVARAAEAAADWGFDLAGRNTAVKPGDNFFEYANGTYVKNLVIPSDQTGYGAFNILRDLSESRTHQILEEAAAHAVDRPTDPIGKAGTFYKTFLDEAAAEAKGATPLKGDLAIVDAVKTPLDFARLAGRGAGSPLPSPFGLDIAPDPKDPTAYSLTIEQGGLGLPDRDYYLSKQFAAKLALYPGYIEKILTLAGVPDAKKAAADIIGFETKLAELHWTRAESRDDDKTYNPVTVAELVKIAPGFDWRAFLSAAGAGGEKKVILAQKSAVIKEAALIGATPVDTLKEWARFHLISGAAGLLSKDFVNANFEFVGKALSGQPEIRPRWKRAVHATEGALGEAIGEAYVARYFPPEARAQMEVLCQGLRDAFHTRLEHNEWMSAETRKKALAKLATFDFHIGYPKKWRDYSALTVVAGDLYGNVSRATEFDWAFQTSHLGHKVDRELWEMTPQTVNAYNEPLLNEVVFPAAILQPPFFNPKADPAVNYGGIGGVIGHEMTHSFDDQGRKHDAQGRLNNWWTAEDIKKFDAKAKAFGAEYAKMEILPGAHITPELTMGENIADLGGLTLALEAYHLSLHGKPAPVIDGLTGDQRVFLGWAQVWRAKLRDDATRQRLTIDPHSPPMARVNGPTQNIDAWYTAFDVKPGDKNYLAPDKRVRIW